MPVDNVKIVAGVPLDRVNTASEANDEQRRREQNKLKNQSAAKKTSPEKTAPAPINEDTTPEDISRQIVDSETVVQLLSHSPKQTAQKLKLFRSDEKSLANKKIDEKINRTL